MPSERKLLTVACNEMSLIGVHGEPPYAWANYFSLVLENHPRGLRISNFWWENLEAAVERFLPDGKVEVLVWEDRGNHFGLIDDKRIPEDWYYNKLCWTGGRCPSIEIAREMYAVHGDPTNQLEQFTDPKSYHEKRGGTYHEAKDGMSFVTYNVNYESKE